LHSRPRRRARRPVEFSCRCHRFSLLKNCATTSKCFSIPSSRLHSAAISENGPAHEIDGGESADGTSCYLFQAAFQCDAKSLGGSIFSSRLHPLSVASRSSNHFGRCFLRRSSAMSRMVISPRFRPSVGACSTISRETTSAADGGATPLGLIQSTSVTQGSPCRVSASLRGGTRNPGLEGAIP
jgi:hypothetical protein